jgi:polysaccharide biosynthesis transport protein
MTTDTDEPLFEADNKIDLVDLSRRFIRRLPIFLIVAAIVMAGVVVFTLTRTPTYTATASVVIEPRRTEVLKEDTVVAGMPTVSEALDTEALILNSEMLAERVVRRLNLHKDLEFYDPSEPPSLFPRPAPKAPSLRLNPEEVAIQAAARAVQGATEVKRSGVTYVIDVSFTSIDPVKAAKIANAQVEEYLAIQLEENVDAARSTGQALESRLKALREEVQRNEAALQQFIIANGLMSASGATMAEQEVSTLNQQIAAAAADVAEKRARLNTARQQIARGGGGGEVVTVPGNETVQSLRKQQADLTITLANLQTRYGPRHPDVLKAGQELQANQAELATEIQRVLSGQEAEVRIAEQRYASLAASRGRAEGALGNNSRAAVGLAELQRRADASRTVYQAFLSRAKDAAAQEGLQKSDARISARARTPSAPTSPNKALNFAAGFVLSMILGGAGVVLAETLDSRLRSSSDIRRRLGLNTVGVVPLMAGLPVDHLNRLVVDKPFSAFAESFRNMKRSIWAATKEHDRRAIAFTSALPEEGKTMTCLAFGRSIARGGARTLIIDADLRRRSLTYATHLSVKQGLVEVLEGTAVLERAIVQDKASGAYLLLLVDAPPPERDLFDGAAWPTLLMDCKDRGFDAIVIDTAPVLGIADTRGIAFHADAVLLVVRWLSTPRSAAAAALQLLQSAGANVIGACLTMVDRSKHPEGGYEETGAHEKAFRKYYQE